MNTSSSSKKTGLWIIVILVVAGIAYFYYSGSSAPTSSSGSLVASGGPDAAVGAQVLTLLNQIQSLRIDTSIFSDAGFKTLRDYSVAIPPVNVGRPNPFAPLAGRSTISTPTTPATSGAGRSSR